MRAADMKVGRSYALASDRSSGPAKVKLLDKDGPRSGWVKIEFVDGIPMGRTVDVPSRRILHEWGKETRAPQGRPSKRPEPPALAVGVTVEWAETGPIPWKVTKLDEQNGLATLKGEIFGRSTVRESPIDALQTVSDEPDPERDRQAREAVKSAIGEVEAPRRTKERRAQSEEVVEPELPNDAKLRLIEQLLFSPELLLKYGRRYARKVERRSPEEQLRRELRRRGKLLRLKPWSRRRKKNEYIRVRVPGRYEIVVPESPSRDTATGYVTEIVGLRRRPKQRSETGTSDRANRRRGRGRR